MSEFSDRSSSSMISSVSPSSSASHRCLTPSSISSSEGISPRPSFADDESSSRDESLHSPISDDDKRRLKFSKPNSLRAKRTSFYAYQLSGLGQVFDKEQYPDPVQRQKIADALDLDFDTVTRWFQNRRAKFRRDRSTGQRKSRESEETPTKRGTGTSSFHMESILRKSPPSEKCSTSSFQNKVTPTETSVNSYYQYFPYYYPSYVYHYYPNVRAHCHSPVSMASEHPILLPVEKPLDLSCSKKRDCVERESEASPKKRKKRRCSEEKREAAAAILDLSRQVGHDDTDSMTEKKKAEQSYFEQLNFSPFPSVYSSAYYRSFPFRPIFHTDDTRRNDSSAGYVPMTSVPVNSVYGNQSVEPSSQ